MVTKREQELKQILKDHQEQVMEYRLKPNSKSKRQDSFETD